MAFKKPVWVVHTGLFKHIQPANTSLYLTENSCIQVVLQT